MPRADKIAIVEATKESAQKAESIVLADFTGLNVEEVTDLRNKLREQSIQYKVIKNTLAKISFEELGRDELLEHLEGPTGFAFGFDDPGAPVRVLLDFSKKTEKPKIKAIWIEGRVFQGDEAKQVADLPSKDQLRANLVVGLNAPIANLVNRLNGIIYQFVLTLAAIKAQKGDQE